MGAMKRLLGRLTGWMKDLVPADLWDVWLDEGDEP